MSQRTQGKWANDGYHEWQIWSNGADGSKLVADCSPEETDVADIFECAANAEFICKAVNAHNRLVETLKSFVKEFKSLDGAMNDEQYDIYEKAKELLEEIK